MRWPRFTKRRNSSRYATKTPTVITPATTRSLPFQTITTTPAIIKVV